LEVWGSPEALETERDSRDVKREDVKRKKYNKKMEKLRKEVYHDVFKKFVQLNVFFSLD